MYLVYVQALFQVVFLRMQLDWKVFATDSKSRGYISEADQSLEPLGWGPGWDQHLVVHELAARQAVEVCDSDVFLCSWPVQTEEVLADACEARKEK